MISSILLKSALQGFAIFAASFGTYFYFLQQNPGNASLARTMGLSILMLANLFLVLVNSSNYDFIFQSIHHLAKDKVMWAILFGTVAGLLLILYSPLNGILKLAPLTIGQFFLVIGISAVSVLWYEIVKWISFRKQIQP